MLQIHPDVPENGGGTRSASQPKVRGADGAKAPSPEQQIRELREGEESRLRFMSVAAHELNTPLTPMGLQIHLLRLKGDRSLADPEVKLHLEILERNFQRLSGLVKDILDATRLQAGRLPLRFAPMNLSDVATSTCEDFKEAADKAGVTLTCVVATDGAMEGDKARVTQLVSNLVANSVKFTPRGGLIQVEVRAEGENLRASVSDTGVGLRPEDVPKLFQPFRQLYEPLKTQGTGLGLFICRGIVEEHGGQVSIASAGPGRGCTVTAVFPRKAMRPSSGSRPLELQLPDVEAGSLEDRLRRLL